jgi:hypothetical protein
MKYLLAAFTLFSCIFITACGNSDQSKSTTTDTTSAKKTDTVPTPPVTRYSQKADIKDPKPGDTVTLLLNFDRYEEGDYAHTVFEEPNSADVEWDFGHPEENKFGDIPIVLKDEKSGWGYKTNPAYVNKRFIVTAEFKNLDGNDLDGKPIKYQDWRVISMKAE